MWKFIIKFYFLFIIAISVMFFSLVFFQKQGMQPNMLSFGEYNGMNNMFQQYRPQMEMDEKYKNIFN